MHSVPSIGKPADWHPGVTRAANAGTAWQGTQCGTGHLIQEQLMTPSLVAEPTGAAAPTMM